MGFQFHCTGGLQSVSFEQCIFLRIQNWNSQIFTSCHHLEQCLRNNILGVSTIGKLSARLLGATPRTAGERLADYLRLEKHEHLGWTTTSHIFTKLQRSTCIVVKSASKPAVHPSKSLQSMCPPRHLCLSSPSQLRQATQILYGTSIRILWSALNVGWA